MQQENNASHSTTHHHSFLPSELRSDEYSSSMREIDDSAVTDSAMADVRIATEESIRSDANNPLLVLAIPSQTDTDPLLTDSPTPSVEYHPGMPSPTFPSQSDPQNQHFTSPSHPGSKRSSAYFADSVADVQFNDAKRRRRDTTNIISDTNPEPSAAAVRAAETLRRSHSRPQLLRCRSHSLPDLHRLATSTAMDTKSASSWQQTQVPSALLLLPSLSSDLPCSPTRRRFRDRPIPPPITRLSLRELENQEIFKNAQLIHDIIHDPSLQFRPNLEGPRGERKRQVAEQYWCALEREVDRLKICLQKDPNGIVKLSSNRFPALFMELRDIMCSLLPPSERALVEEVVDPEFLCQQLFRGVLNAQNLARFLGRIMKEHCAPMRDTMVEKMMAQFEYAQQSGNTQAFVLGLRMVFELLEGMKLDVANHQLRTMKKELQDRAVSNEREYFEERVAKGKLNLTPVLQWIKPSLENKANGFLGFTKAFLGLLTPSSGAIKFPPTFLFDNPRLTNFRKDFRDLISVQLCLLLYRELAISFQPNTAPPPLSSFSSLRLEIWSILSDLSDTNKYSVASASLAVQIALRAAQHTSPSTTVPPSHLVTLAQNWIETNVASGNSKLFSVTETRVFDFFVEHLLAAQANCVPQTPLRGCEYEGTIVWATGTETAMWLLGERMHRVAAFHWTVFGDLYLKSSLEE